MTRMTFSLEVFGDRFPVADITERGTNERQLDVMRNLLKKAINSELTARQREMVTDFYFNGQSVTEIARKHGLSKSTVSRHLSCSRERLKCAMKYGLYPLWQEDA